MKHIIFILALLIGTFSLSFAQPRGKKNNRSSKSVQVAPNIQLAQEYFKNGEFEKAASLYEKLIASSPMNSYYFSKYMSCLTEMEEYDKAESVLKTQLKSQPKNSELYLEYGNLMELQEKADEADKQYAKAIKLLPPNQGKIDQLARKFTALGKYELAIATYDRGNEMLDKPYVFSYQIGDVYRRTGELNKMIENYLYSLEYSTNRLSIVQTYLQRYLSDEDFGEVKKQLYERIQDKPDITIYPELLQWVFLQQKDFKGALRQAKALDKRLKEDGGRVFKLATSAKNEKDYDAAITAFNYITEIKGTISPYYLKAKRETLNTRRTQLTDGYQYTDEDLLALENEYQTFLQEFGRNKTTAGMIRELSQLHAFYLNDIDKAIELLDEAIDYPDVDRHTQALAKLDLGDYYLIKEELWESSLLYSQVDKEFKDDILGEVARFRNAKLSYFKGDFEWAQAQLDVLKASTSELISNDAIDLSVFIMDHYSLDTTAVPMEMYAGAELLSFQNRFDEAFVVLDSIEIIFPGHGLKDDVYYAKSKIYAKQRDYEKAAEMLQFIVDNHAEEIRGDNATFDLAQLYETHLDDKEKAKALYQKILMEYSGSTFSVEARKRFRILRGDGTLN